MSRLSPSRMNVCGLDGGDLFGLALDSPQTSIPVNLVKKTGAAEVPGSGEVGI